MTITALYPHEQSGDDMFTPGAIDINTSRHCHKTALVIRPVVIILMGPPEIT